MKPPLSLLPSAAPPEATAAQDLADDGALFGAWQTGDRAAGEALIERHYDSVVRFLRTKAGPHADDLVQRVFLVCVDRGVHFRGDSSFRAFLFGIARNVVFEFIRGKVATTGGAAMRSAPARSWT